MRDKVEVNVSFLWTHSLFQDWKTPKPIPWRSGPDRLRTSRLRMVVYKSGLKVSAWNFESDLVWNNKMEVEKWKVNHNLLDQCRYHQSVAHNMEQDPDKDFPETKLKITGI